MKMRMENVLIVVITVLVLVVLVTVYNKNNKKEDFINVRAYGQSFGQYYPPNPNPNPHPPSCQLNTFPNPSACTPENNCFPGAQLRTQVYQNLCNDYQKHSGCQWLMYHQINKRYYLHYLALLSALPR
mgnify:CR=1 FL=1